MKSFLADVAAALGQSIVQVSNTVSGEHVGNRESPKGICGIYGECSVGRERVNSVFKSSIEKSYGAKAFGIELEQDVMEDFKEASGRPGPLMRCCAW
ncbi:hypothetical protein LZ554_008030 [Drepanopeziza brunnea f. sp. 'monogermtubi']|nr:hypothetical protein LZ554_008030 [Drepanopeziza brunnea f. sp. 'monogermtubi']